MMRQITNRIFIANSGYDPSLLKQSINMAVILITNREGDRIADYSSLGILTRQHPIEDKSQIKEIVKRYSFVISSGDSIIIVCDDLTFTREFILELLYNTCGLSYGDSIDLLQKKLKQ